MKPLYTLVLLLTALCAHGTDLSSLLAAAARSDAAQAQRQSAQSVLLRQRSELLTDGPVVNAAGGYAKAKQAPDDGFEYRLSLEKPFRTADTATLESLFGAGAAITVELAKARLLNGVYGDYIDACALQEELWLLEDAKSRGVQMEALIRTGMEGGEFDRSAWLRSRLNVRTLTLEIETLKSRYAEALLRLGAATQLQVSEPQCSDLPDTIALPPRERFEHAPLLGQLENALAGAKAMKTYRDAWVNEVTLGAGYDDEIDLRRGALFASIPLGVGDRREAEREAARRAALAADAELRAMDAKVRARIAAFDTAQQTRRSNLKHLNDELIPEAYETTVLLEERFMGSEASYLEYIDSQQTLFKLLMEGVQLRAAALRAEAELFGALGITPLSYKDDK